MGLMEMFDLSLDVIDKCALESEQTLELRDKWGFKNIDDRNLSSWNLALKFIKKNNISDTPNIPGLTTVVTSYYANDLPSHRCYTHTYLKHCFDSYPKETIEQRSMDPLFENEAPIYKALLNDNLREKVELLKSHNPNNIPTPVYPTYESAEENLKLCLICQHPILREIFDTLQLEENELAFNYIAFNF